MHWLYSTLLAFGLLISLPYWLWQAVRHGKYVVGLGQRLGRVPARLLTDARPAIWVHAVSVGEVLAVSGLIAKLRDYFPQYRVLISTTTDTGQKLAQSRFDKENVFYFPLDFGFAVHSYLRKLRPRLVILAETEFWPNFLRVAHAQGARIAVVNARISDRSLPGYRRWRWIWRRLLRPVDLFLAQTEEDQQRLIGIGAPCERVQVSGNLKFDVALPSPPAIVSALRSAIQQAHAGPVFVCGSTVEGEEGMLLSAFKQVHASHPRAVMILAPRHPQRFAQVLQLLEKDTIPHRQRSLWSGEPFSGGIFLLDSIGELASLYALSDIAFVGGSLVPRGGHNILEPAQYGVPILIGRYTENFRDIVKSFAIRSAVRVVEPAELALAFLELASNEEERKSLGRLAAETLRAQTGATQRTLAALVSLLEESPAGTALRTAFTEEEGGCVTPR